MNYTPASPLPSHHRLARLHNWLALTIACFAAHVLALFAPEAAARELDRYARSTRALLILRAMRGVAIPPAQPPRPNYENRSRKRRLTFRQMAGAALRRALKARTLAERARALYAALAEAEHWIARITRRLVRRFTKLRRLRYRALAAPAQRDACAAHAFADSS